MSVLAPPAPLASSRSRFKIPTLPIYRLSVKQYHRMIETGILTEDDPVELLRGLLVEKMSKNPPHTTATGLVRDALAEIIPPGWFVNAQEPITLSSSEPEPDVSIIRGDRRAFRGSHPAPIDLGLLVEVSESTLDRDRGEKSEAYGEAGIDVYWIVNLVARQVEVRTGPTINGYTQERIYRPGEVIPVNIAGTEVGRVRVDDLLP